MHSVRYGTCHFYKFSLYKFSINLTNKVSLPDHFWTRNLGWGMLCAKKLMELGLGRQFC